MYACSNWIFFFTFSISKNYRFLKQMTNTAFHNTIIPSTIYLQELAAFDDAYLSWGWSKIWLYERDDSSAIVNIFVKTL